MNLYNKSCDTCEHFVPLGDATFSFTPKWTDHEVTTYGVCKKKMDGMMIGMVYKCSGDACPYYKPIRRVFFSLENIVYLSNGNAGALSFIHSAYEEDKYAADAAFYRMYDYKITGSKLYMLWSDCCGRDTMLALKIMLRAPIEAIKKHINEEGGRGFPFNEEEKGRFGIT